MTDRKKDKTALAIHDWFCQFIDGFGTITVKRAWDLLYDSRWMRKNVPIECVFAAMDMLMDEGKMSC